MTYYTRTALTAHTTARSVEVNAQLAAIEAGFNKLPTEDRVKRGKVHDATDSGAANAYVLTATHAKSSYETGDTYRFRPSASNTTASTVNIYNASSVLIGVVSLLNYAGDALSGGEALSGVFLTISFDGTGFRIVQPLTSIASVSVFAVNSLTEETSADDADFIGLYDVSAGADRKMKRGNLIPDATTSVKGKVQLATVAQAAAGSSSLLAVTPAALLPLVRRINPTSFFMRG